MWRTAAATLLAAWAAPRPAESRIAEAGFQNRYYQASGYSGSHVLEHNETGRFETYVEVAWYQSVAVDQQDRVWVVDRAYHQVLLMHPSTRYVPFSALYTEYAGGRGQPGHLDGSRMQARFDNPTGLAVTQDPQTSLVIFVADTNNHCVRRLDFATGRTNTIAGLPGERGLRDGRGQDARLNSPMSLGLDATGVNLFVLDNSRRIRYIDLSNANMVTTMADGACRSVSRWTVSASILMRSVGCHKDWRAKDVGDAEVETRTREMFCVGHQATCGPRKHPVIADSSSKHLHPRPEQEADASQSH